MVDMKKLKRSQFISHRFLKEMKDDAFDLQGQFTLYENYQKSLIFKLKGLKLRGTYSKHSKAQLG